MRVATFNANSIRSRLGIVQDWLREHAPDILCIQETKVVDEQFPEAGFNDVGYHVVYRGQKSYNGVAIASRTPPDAFDFGLPSEPVDDARLAYARFGTLHVVNTYVPQGREITHEMYRYKQAWLKRLSELFEARFSTRKRVLWTGDMNVAVESIDIHNAEKQSQHVCYHADIREVFAETVNWGFEDLFRKHHPGEPDQYTFYDYRTPNAAKRKMGWRIDHMLATSPLARRCTNCWIDIEPRLKPKPSDHTFLVADFQDGNA